MGCSYHEAFKLHETVKMLALQTFTTSNFEVKAVDTVITRTSIPVVYAKRKLNRKH